MEPWPFSNPPNVACIADRQIINGEKPVLLALCDAEDESYVFLTGGEFDISVAVTVTLRSVVQLDPTLAELSELRPGWSASRSKVGAAWQFTEDQEVE